MNQYIYLLLLITVVYADLPVHCMKHQIEGKWKMSITKPLMKGYGPLPCGHHIPDTQRSSYQAGWDEFQENEVFTLNLNNDYSVDDGNRRSNGQWTMIYDEGFEVKLNDINYLAFSKYSPNGSDYKSHCGETLIGWYNNQKTGERGCYKANKEDGEVQATDSLEMRSVVQPEFIQTSVHHHDKVKLHKNFDNHAEAVEKLNKNTKKTWKAKAHSMFEGKTLKELNQMAGRKKYHQSKERKSYSFAEVKNRDVSDLPKEYSAQRYLAPPRQQKSCGSCYAISTMEMLSARLRMQGEDVTLSPQYSLDCNYYNQGCDGGYPYLVEKFATEQFLVTEEQYPYKADTMTCRKTDFSTSNKVYAAKNYKYIGGGYGLSNERDIMLELFNNGPMILNFEPTQEFMYYDGGIYHSVETSDWASFDKPEWEKVDHSVLCFGWGEENGQKYWLLQNSWGQQWGEDGNFRMRRGVDESAIESMAESADPIILTKSNQGQFVEIKNQILLQKNYQLNLRKYE